MSAAVTKAGPYYSTGSIAFRSLRTNFKETSSGAIKFSELLRNTTQTDTNPVVPDATENGSIPVSSSNVRASLYRNSIKYYYITQTGTDENFDIDAQSWNSNLTKNIRKWMYINGICGSNSISSVAAEFNATAYNLTVDVSGAVYGAAGRGGGTGGPDPSGESAGTAMSITAPGNNTVVYVRTGARIYGGGGGGERGARGSNGNGGRCCRNYTNRGCGGAPGCGGDRQTGYRNNCGGCCQNYRCGWSTCCSQNWQCRDCESCYNTNGGTGGAGGVGGLGRGYNNLTGSTAGGAGSNGSSGGGCGANNGGTGQTGGAGGDWASNGTNTGNSGNGGSAGKAIIGSNYIVTGVVNADTVKGSYNP